jgi:uncharacterized protein HemX
MKVALCIAISCFLAGCNQQDSANRDDRHETPGQQAGKAAYEVEKGAKKAAKELDHDVKTFAHDAHEGFKQQKEKDQVTKKSPDDNKDEK